MVSWDFGQVVQCKKKDAREDVLNFCLKAERHCAKRRNAASCSLRAFYRTGTEAASADMHRLRNSIDQHTDALDIGFLLHFRAA